MTITIGHAFASTVPESPGAGVPGGPVGANEWNANHNITAAANTILGNNTNSGGAVLALTVAQVNAMGVGSGWFNVKSFGATGNGVTDDTAAINLAIAAFNTAGSGRLYFPAGNYLCSAALTAITANGIVEGDGKGDNLLHTDLVTSSPTYIQCTSQTAVFFTINSAALTFRDLTIYNSYSGTPSSASAGIQVTNGSNSCVSINYYGILVYGFYINIDVQTGTDWVLEGSTLWGHVEYGIRIQNTLNTDDGDWCISNCLIQSGGGRNATAGIKQSGAGGGKIINTKFNTDHPGNTTTTDCYNGDLTSTGDLLICNCSFEWFSNTAITLTNATEIVIHGNQITAGSNGTSPSNDACIRTSTVSCLAVTGNAVENAASGTCYLFDAFGSTFNMVMQGNQNGNLTAFVNPSSVNTNLSFADGLFETTGGPFQVASLPAAGIPGRRFLVNNANSTTFGSVAAGGGSNTVPVYDDGTNWRLG